MIVFGRGRILRELTGAELVEGAHRRAGLHSVTLAEAERGGRRDGRRVSQQPAASRRRDRRAQAAAACSRRVAAAALRALRAAPRLGWSSCIVFAMLRPDTFLTTANFTTIFGSQAILVVLTLGAARAAHRRRLRPLGRGDDDARGDGARDPERQPRLVDLAASILAALGVGAGRRARQRRARRRARHRLADRDARHARRSSPGIVLWISDSQTISGISRRADRLGRRRTGSSGSRSSSTTASRSGSSSATSSSSCRSGGGSCSSAAAAASRGCPASASSHAALGRARRLRPDQRLRRASSTPARSAPPTRPRA